MKTDKTISDLFKKHRSDLSHTMPTELRAQILNQATPQPRERISFLRWMSFGGGVVAASLALVMTFQLGRMSVSGSSHVEEVVSSHVHSLMAAHLSDVVSTDQHTVKPWFEGKIDFAPTVRDFAANGFPLIGGRLDYIDGRTTAALVYKSNQHVINVLQHPASANESSGPRLKTVRGYQVFSWVKDGMSYWAVSDLNAADLQKFVDLWVQ